MLKLSIILANRIAQNGRTNAFQYHRHQSKILPLQRRKFASRQHMALENDDEEKYNDIPRMRPPPKSSRKRSSQSRLASIYDQMFEDDGDVGSKGSKVPVPSSNSNDVDQSGLQFKNSEALEKERDFSFDNDFPQQDLSDSFSENSMPLSKPRQDYTNSPKSNQTENRQFRAKSKPPPKARMYMGREMPPMVSEYDRSHYDDEFGAVKSGEGGGYLEFNDAMWEELGGERVTPQMEKTVEKKEVAQRQTPPGQEIQEGQTQTNIVHRNLSETDELPMPKNYRPQSVPPPRPVSRATVSSQYLEVHKVTSNGSGASGTGQISMLQEELVRIEGEVYALNDGKKFNINSPKQVSLALFGVENESTNKEALEALTGNISNHGGNAVLARMILNYRSKKRELSRLEKQQVNKESGTHVENERNMRSANTKTLEKVTPTSLVMEDEREPLVLIDASAYIFRAYYSMPPMHRNDGEPTGATLGFCNMLNKLVMQPLLEGERPRIVLVFDSKDGTNFRKELFSEYKSNRKACPEDLIPQFDFVRDAADAYGVPILEAPGFEADDVIATLATMALNEDCHVNILSGDKDLMQLVTKDEGGACIEMIDPMKMVRYDFDAVVDKWGVRPDQLGDVLALAGDSADNIPGVAGIGPKIAQALIAEYGSLDALFENVNSIKQKGRREKIQSNIDIAKLSRQLVELERKVPFKTMSFPSQFNNVSDFRMEKLDSKRLLDFYERMGFRDIKRRLKSRLSSQDKKQSSRFDRFESVVDSGKKTGRKEKNDVPNEFPDVPF